MLPEAMLCELVVISYNVGLAKDLTSNEESGFICTPKFVPQCHFYP